MKKTALFLGTALFFSLTGCKSNSGSDTGEDSEPIVHDSVGVTTGVPITEQVDSLAADTLGLADPAHTDGGVQTRVEKYVNDQGDAISVTYNNNNGMGVATLEIGGKEPIKLMQKEASEHMESYTNGKINWQVKEGSEATLEMDNVITKYKRK